MVGQLLELGKTSNASSAGKRPVADTFTRIEDKFFIPRQVGNELIALIERHLDPCYPEDGTKFNMIESLYFDSGSLDIYRSHFEKLDKRFKIRIRRYAANGVWKDDSVHLELKAKENGISKKARFKIGPAECSMLSLGHKIPLSIELIRRNSSMGTIKLIKRLSRVNSIITKYGLKPSCRVTYMRRAFERDSLRVTIDDQIRYQILNNVQTGSNGVVSKIFQSEGWTLAQQMRNTFLRSDHLILEVKHSGTVPAWIEEFVARSGSAKTSFSKYCFTMSEHLERERARQQ